MFIHKGDSMPVTTPTFGLANSGFGAESGLNRVSLVEPQRHRGTENQKGVMPMGAKLREEVKGSASFSAYSAILILRRHQLSCFV